MSDSILNSTKKLLGLAEDYSAFDVDILMHINTVFATLSQLGVGPATGFMIEDAVATWEDFLGADKNLNFVKTYMVMKVRMAFDPPATSFAISAINEQIKELEWRINVHRETTGWISPVPIPDWVNEVTVIDGGAGW